MAFPNEITFSGTLCNIEYKQSNNGNFFTKGALKIYQGQEKDDAWYDVVVFNNERQNLADNVADCFSPQVKSLPVIIKGKLDQSEWTKQDGSKGRNYTIIANEVAVSTVFGAVGIIKSGEPQAVPEPQARPVEEIAEGEAPF